MLFSIIVPVYKVEKYLEHTINSILQQSFKDFEIILIDDYSPDRSGDICDLFALTDERIKVVHNTQNLGVSETRNKFLSLAKGNWIWFVDSDDWISENALEMLSKQVSDEFDVVLFGFQYIIEKKNNSFRKGSQNIPSISIVQTEKDLVNCVMNQDAKHAFAPIWNKIYRRNFLCDNNLKFKNTSLEDVFFNLNVFLYTNRIKIVDNCFYFYRRRLFGSLSKTKSLERSDIYKKRYFTFVDFLRKRNCLTVFNRSKAFLNYICRLFYVMYVALISKKKM